MAVTWMINPILAFFGGLLVPMEYLPSAIQPISNLLPTTHAADALTSLLSRGASVTAPTVVMDIIGISIFTAVVYAIGVLLFRRSSTLF